MNSVVAADMSDWPRRDQNRKYRTVGTLSVVTAKISGVGCDLIQVCLGRINLTLQLQHDHRAAYQEDDIRAPQVHREFVFEYCDVLGCKLVSQQNLVHLIL